MHRIFLIALAFVSFPLAAQPSAEAISAEVTDNIATEYAECAAYFAILEGAFANSGKSTESAKFKAASDKAAEFSLISAKQSRSEEMATKVTLARFEMSLKAMQKTIDNNYSNISLLMNKHSDSCVEDLTNSAAFMKRWSDRISAKYGITPMHAAKLTPNPSVNRPPQQLRCCISLRAPAPVTSNVRDNHDRQDVRRAFRS